MHYPDESYVRKYTRKTLNWHRLKWQGRTVKDAMLGEFDRAGVFELPDDADPVECIAAVTELPDEIVRAGLERLVATRTWKVTATAIVWPNYVEGQNCAKSDAARQAESRRRRAELAGAGEAPPARVEPDAAPSPPPAAPPGEVVRPGESHAVTSRHEPSREVTPSPAQPTQTHPNDLALARAGECGGALAPEVRPSRRRRRRRRHVDGWEQFPVGWQWSLETTAAATARGLTRADLQRHVDYWTTHRFGAVVTDLDGELVRCFDDIVERKSAKLAPGPASTTTSSIYDWRPTAEHRAFCRSRALDLDYAARRYRESGTPDRLGSLTAHDDFMRRLRWWAEHDEFIPAGKAPAKAVNA